MVAPPTAADGNRVSPAEQLCSLFFVVILPFFFVAASSLFCVRCRFVFFLLFSGHGGGFHAVGSNRNPPAKKFSFCDCFLFCFWFSWFCFVFLHSVRIKLMAIAVRSNRNQLATLVIKNIVPKRYRRNRPRSSKVFFWVSGFVSVDGRFHEVAKSDSTTQQSQRNRRRRQQQQQHQQQQQQQQKK